MIAIQNTWAEPKKLKKLADIVKTRTPIYDQSGDIHIKLDTAVDGTRWYVVTDDSRSAQYASGLVPCWMFPHFNGSHEFYTCIPAAFCYETFEEVLDTYPEWASELWTYDRDEYARRAEYARQATETTPHIIEVSEREYQSILAGRQ